MRRLKTLVALPALTAALDAQASDKEDPRPVLFGVTIAGGLSNAMALPFGYSYLSYLGTKKPLAAPDFGASLTWFRRRATAKREARGQLVRKFVALEVHYARFGNRFGKKGQTSLDLRMITAPIVFRTDYRPIGGSDVRPTFQWGPQLGFKLSEEFTITYADGTTASYDLGYLFEYMPFLRAELGVHLGAGISLELPGRHEARLLVRVYQGLVPDIAIGLGLHQQVSLAGGLQF